MKIYKKDRRDLLPVYKGVAILDLPMILLPNEIINKYMQNMKNLVSVCTYLLFYKIINKNHNYLTPILLHNDL